MKENTYIIPAIDFYIVKPNDSFESFEDAEFKIKQGRVSLIPFGYVDGLLVDELINNFGLTNNFLFCAINMVDTIGGDRYMNILHTSFFNTNSLENQMNCQIDKVIEQLYSNSYHTVSIRSRQIYNSFFERYQDGDYEKTKQRIKR